MNDVDESPKRGIGLLGIALFLQAVFAALKLSGAVDWPWPVVLSPMLVWLALVVAAILLVGISACIGLMMGEWK